jgi:uncharacterized protein (UPF0548 family)
MSRNSNATAYSRQLRIGPVSNVLLVGLIITIMGLMYLVQITKTSVYGFELGELRSTQTELSQRNQALEVEAARLQSLSRTEDSDIRDELVPQTDVSYLSN